GIVSARMNRYVSRTPSITGPSSGTRLAWRSMASRTDSAGYWPLTKRASPAPSFKTAAVSACRLSGSAEPADDVPQRNPGALEDEDRQVTRFRLYSHAPATERPCVENRKALPDEEAERGRRQDGHAGNGDDGNPREILQDEP